MHESETRQHSRADGHAPEDMGKLPDGVAEVASLYLASLELENYDEDMKERVYYALYFGPCGLKTNDFSSAEIYEDDNLEEVMNSNLIGV